MALVLTGIASYGASVELANGTKTRISLRRGQSLDGLDLSENELERLKALEVRGPGRRSVPLFTELPSAFDGARHRSGGPIVSPAQEKRDAEKAAEEAALKAEADKKAAAAKVAAEAEVEKKPEPKKAAPKKSTSKKAAPKKRAPKKAAPKKAEKKADDNKKSD